MVNIYIQSKNELIHSSREKSILKGEENFIVLKLEY